MTPFRERWIDYGLLILAVFLVVGPFVWILIASFKHQIAIYTGAWVFTPTLANYAEVLLSRRSDFIANGTSGLLRMIAALAGI